MKLYWKQIVLGIFALIAVSGYWWWSDRVVSVALVYPVFKTAHRVTYPFKCWYMYYQERNNLVDKLEKVLSENRTLWRKNIEMEGTLSYLKDTWECRAFRQRYHASTILTAEIIMQNFDEQEHYVLVDIGAWSGVKQNMVAVVHNALFGRVVEVFPCYAKIALMTDASQHVPCYGSQTNTRGIHEGVNDCMQTRLAYVSHLDNVEEGELFLTRGEGLIFPRGFALGRVKRTKVKGVYKQVDIEPLFDPRSVRHCMLFSNGSWQEPVKP